MAGFMLPVAGVLGIQSDAAPAFYLNNDFPAGAVKAYVTSAPMGADLIFSIYVGIRIRFIRTCWFYFANQVTTSRVTTSFVELDNGRAIIASSLFPKCGVTEPRVTEQRSSPRC